MSKYEAIKAATNAYIKTNGRQEITGAILNAVMIATIDSLGRFYQFVGSASPDTNPGTIDQNIAYIAAVPGTYTHLGGFTLAPGEVAVIKYDGQWKKEVIIIVPSKVSELENDLGFITNAVADLVNYYTKTETYTRNEISSILSEYYDKGEVDALVDALTRNSYIVSWDGTAEPDVTKIPAGVEVTYGGTPYTGTLQASASTLGYIYLVSNGAGYDMYVTIGNPTYSWLGIGTTTLDLSGYVTASAFADLAEDVEDIKIQITIADKYYLQSAYIDNLYVATSDIARQTGRRLYYVPIKANETIYASFSFTNAYVRCGFCTDFPARYVSIDKSVISVGGTGTGTKSASCSPVTNGYFCISFDDPSSIQYLNFYVNTSGVGKAVKDLQNQIGNLVAYDGYITGRGTTSVTTTIPLPEGRYNLTIRDFVRGYDNRSYLIFRLKVGTRIVASYYGQDLVPYSYYFDVLPGETSVEILSRSEDQKDYAVRIVASEQNGIFDFNPIGEQIDRLMNARKAMQSDDTPFVLLHFTDIHADEDRLKRILEYYTTLGYGIDDIIHTGDAVGDKVDATSFDFWDDCGAERVLNCIGNHDVWYDEGFSPAPNYPYDTYFKPYIDNADWGTIVQPANAEADGKCYYYKDYDNGIRLIVLDYQNPAGMMTWFADSLDDARTNDLSVIVAVHYVPNWTAGYHNSFDISQFVNIVLNLSPTFTDSVDTFIGNGGKFVCWITGHTHRDNAGYYQGTNGKQVIINLDCAALRNDGKTRYRGENSKSQDCFNIMAVNTGAKLLSIFRVGNDIDALQRHSGSMCIKYDTGELVWTN